MAPIEVNSDTKNWLKVGLALKHLKNGLIPFVCHHISTLHTVIINNYGTCNTCTTENVLSCPTTSMCKFKHKRCQYHNQADPQKQARLCPNSICQKVSVEIKKTHLWSPNWKNTDATKWASNPWEIAKCFLPPGYAGVQSAMETDCTAILSLCLNCRPLEAAITPVKTLVEKNRTNRNLVMHSGRQELTDTERADYIQDAIDLLTRYQTPVDPNTQKCIDILTELNKDGFILTTDDIVDVMKTAVESVREEQEAFRVQQETIQNELIIERAVAEERKHSIDQLQENKIDQETYMKKIMELDNKLKAIDSKLQTLDESAQNEIRKQMEAVRQGNETMKTDICKQIESIEADMKQMKSVQMKEAKKRKQLQTEVDEVKSKVARQDELVKAVQKLEGKMEVIEESSRGSGLEDVNPDKVKTTVSPLTPDEQKTLKKTEDQKCLHEHLVCVYKKTCSKMPVAPPKRGMFADIKDHFRKQDMKQVKMPHEPNGEQEEKATIGEICNTNGHQGNNVDIGVEWGPKGNQESHKLTDQVNSYNDIFYRKGKKCLNIYIKGEAGTGKSVFCQNMVYKWCNNDSTFHDKVNSNSHVTFGSQDKDASFLQNFQFLFYIQLRYATEYRDIIPMIKEILLMGDEHLTNVLTDVLKNEPEKCLVLLDGLDEWAPPKGSTPAPHVTRGLPGRNIMINWTVLTTTRPWKLELIRPESEEMDQLIELSGLTQDSTKECIDSVISYLNTRYNTHKEARECTDHLNTKDLKHFMTLPVLLKQLVCVWFDEGQVGNARCDIYAGMIDVYLRYAKQRQENVDTSTDLPSEIYSHSLPPCLDTRYSCKQYKQQIYTLSALAFHTLVSEDRKSALVFNGSIAERYNMTERDANIWLDFGLLSQDVFDEQSAFDQKQLSFPHKSIQEFLAAVYITMCDDDTALKRLEKSCSTVDMILEFSQVLIFVAGMNPTIFTKVSEHVVGGNADIQNYRSGGMMTSTSLINSVYSVQGLMLQCFKESRDNKHMSIDIHIQDLIVNYGETDTPKLIELMQGNKSTLVSMHCERKSSERKWELSKDLTDILLTNLTNLETLSLQNLSFHSNSFAKKEFFRQFIHLRYVHFSGLQLKHHQVQHILSLAQNTEMRGVALCKLLCKDCKDRCEYQLNLSENKQLQILSLRNPFVNDMQEASRRDAHLYGCQLDLTLCMHLQQLYLDCLRASKVLINTAQLKTCHINNLRASDAEPPRYESALSAFEFNGSAEKLRYLNLSNIHLKHDHLHVVIPFVLQSTCLEQIQLSVLKCVDCGNTCEYQLNLSNHTELKGLILDTLRIDSLRVNTSQLVGCKLTSIRSSDTEHSGNNLGMGAFEFVGSARALHVISLRDINLRHVQLQELMSFLMATTSLGEIYLSRLRCVDCGNSCSCRLDLSQHAHIQFLTLNYLYIDQLRVKSTEFLSLHLHVDVLEVDTACLLSVDLHVNDLTVNTTDLKKCSITDMCLTDDDCSQTESAMNVLKFIGSDSQLMELELNNIHLKHGPFQELISFLCRKLFRLYKIKLSEMRCVDCLHGCSCRLDLVQYSGEIRLIKLNIHEVRVCTASMVADNLCVNILHIEAEQLEISNTHVAVLQVNSERLRRCLISNLKSHNCESTNGLHELTFNENARRLNVLELSVIALKHDHFRGLMAYLKQATRLRKIRLYDLRCVDCDSTCDSLLDLRENTQLRMLEINMLHIKEIKVSTRYLEANNLIVDKLQVECKQCESKGAMLTSNVTHETKLYLFDSQVNHLQIAITQLDECTITNIRSTDCETSGQLSPVSVIEYIGTTQCLRVLKLSDIALWHGHFKDLISFIKKATHLSNLELSYVQCVGCNTQCGYQLDLSNHTQLSSLKLDKLHAKEVLTNNTHQVLHNLQVCSPLPSKDAVRLDKQESCTHTPVDLTDSQPLQQNISMSSFEFICTARFLQGIQLSDLALKHNQFRGLMSVLARTICLRSICLSDLKCIDCFKSCECQLDLSEHSLLEVLEVENLQVNKVKVNTTQLEECTITNLSFSSVGHSLSDSNAVILVFIGIAEQLRKLVIREVMLNHEHFQRLMLFLTKTTWLKEMYLSELRCVECATICTCLLDLSQHTQLENLKIEKSHVGQVHVNTTRLGVCINTNEQCRINAPPRHDYVMNSFQFNGIAGNLTTVTLGNIVLKYDQHLELMEFLTKATYLQELTLSHIECVNCTIVCEIRLNLSNHACLLKLKLDDVHINEVEVNTTRLKRCTLVNLRGTGIDSVVSVCMPVDKAKRLNNFVLGNTMLKHENLDMLVSFLTNVTCVMYFFEVKCSDCDEECSCIVHLNQTSASEYDEDEDESDDDDDNDDYDKYNVDDDDSQSECYEFNYCNRGDDDDDYYDTDLDTDFDDDDSDGFLR